MNRRRFVSILVHPASRRGLIRRSAPIWLGLIATVGSAIPPATGDVVPWLPTFPEIPIVAAGYPCSSHSGEWPTFTGFLSNTSGGQLSETTTGDVYGRAQNVDARWQPTPGCGAYRYDGIAWATTNATDPLTVDWGELSGDGQPCNYTVGTSDYVHENNGACPSATSARQLTHLTPQWTYQNDSALDTKGDFAFVHSDCTTDYGADRHWEAATIAGNTGRPGNNCGDKAIDGTNTAQTLVVDWTAPSVAITWPPAGGPLIVPSAFAAVTFTATDEVAGFDTVDGWSLQRQKAAVSGPASCETVWSSDGAAATGFLNQATPNQVSSQGLLPSSCYRWTLWARDRNGNVSATVTSGSIRTDVSGALGDQPQFRFETWALGGGDSLSVSTGSGNLRVTHPIVSLPIRSGLLNLSATYNSLDTGPTVGLGPGWRLNVQRRLAVDPATGWVTFTDADGSRHVFKNPAGSGILTYARPDTLYATLTRDTSATPDRFTLTYRDQSKDVFDEDLANVGLLKQIVDRFGTNVVAVAYASGTSRITTITDPAGRTITFTWVTAPGPERLTQIVDWANVDAGGVVTTSGSGNRTHRFFYDGAYSLAGWADALNPNSAQTCPLDPGTDLHLTCLGYAGGLLSAVSKQQTVEGLAGSTLSTTIRTVSSEIGYAGYDVVSVKDAEEVNRGQLGTTFAHNAPGQTTVVRHGTPSIDSTATYALVSVTDAWGRIASVKRALGSTIIEQLTLFDTTYPIEPASINENNGGVLATPTRTTCYTYVGSSLGLISVLTEPIALSPAVSRTTTFTYNSNNDVTQTVVARLPSDPLQPPVTNRYCYDSISTCATSSTGLTLVGMIENYQPGGPQNADTNVKTEFVVDAYGQRSTEIRHNRDAIGGNRDDRMTAWTYDNLGNRISEVLNVNNGSVTCPGDDIIPNASTGARSDLTTVYTYDTAGNAVSVADPRRAIALASNASCQGPSLNPDDYTSRTAYDALGLVVSQTLPTTPSGSGGIACSPDPACRRTASVYDELGGLREMTSFAPSSGGALQVGIEFDRAGRSTRSFEDTDGADAASPSVVAQTVYDEAGRIVDEFDRIQAQTGSTAGSTHTSYDSLGRTTSVKTGFLSSPSPSWVSETTTGYDALNRVVQTVVGAGGPAAQTTTISYDVASRATTTNDGFTCQTAVYDYRDHLTSLTDGLDGTCASVAGQTRTIASSIDGLGRTFRQEITSGPGTGDRSQDDSLDSAGNRLSSATKTVGVTSTTTFVVNLLDQVLSETRPNGAVSKANYDAVGNITDRCVWSSPSSDACAQAGSSFSNPQPIQVTSTGYDARSQRISLAMGTGSSVSQTTTYNPSKGYQISASYLQTGTGKEYQTFYTYDTRMRLTTITHQLCVILSGHTCSSTTPMGSDTYAYDDNNNRSQIVESKDGGAATTTYYCYDTANRLVYRNTSAPCSPAAKDESNTYDATGNRTQSVTSGITTNFAYTTTGQLCKVGATSCSTPNVTYDSDGRTATWNGWAFVYDAEVRLVSACQSSSCSGAGFNRVDFTYDSEGNRTQIKETTSGGSVTTTSLTYQGDSVVSEVVSTGTTRTFVADDMGRIVRVTITGDPDPDDNATFLVVWNGHGDATSLWRLNGDGSMTLANSYTYSTWGMPTTTVLAPFSDLKFRFLYVGAADVQWDASFGLNLHYMHARHFSPALARFLQPDPATEELNLYSYAANNPTTRIDPTGTSGECVLTIPYPFAFLACVGISAAVMALWSVVVVGGAIAIAPAAPAQVTQNREAGLQAEQDWLRANRKPGKFYVFHVYFPYPKPPAPRVWWRFLDICEYNSFHHYASPSGRWHPNICYEIKSGRARYGGLQASRDALLMAAYRFPIVSRQW